MKMLNDYRTTPVNEFWTFEWNEAANPVVFFSNAKVNTNVIYTLCELQKVVSRSDKENLFIPVPREVLQNALETHDRSEAIAA